ncbi:MAG: guanylate kinase [Planctomycetota bacterium]
MDHSSSPGMMPGMLLIVSGPSGSGKSTLVGELLASGEFPIAFSVSATSRAPRAGEIDGKQYCFLTRARFEEMRGRGEFLEHAEVHGNLYGTPAEPVRRQLAQGQWVLLEIDVQGHQQVKRVMPEAVSFFVRTPSAKGYEQRLKERGTDSPETIARRVAHAEQELAQAADYDFQIVNESVPQAVRTMKTLLWGLLYQRGLKHAR